VKTADPAEEIDECGLIPRASLGISWTGWHFAIGADFDPSSRPKMPIFLISMNLA
jgi:hypothetical protein